MGDIPSTVPPSPISWLNPRLARWLVPILLLFGIECWLVLGAGDYGPPRKSRILLACLIAGLIPPINRAFNRLYIAIASPSPRTRRLICLAIWIASTFFLYWSQVYEKIPLHPKWEDEFSYLIQMRMLAHGHFWLPPIPLPRYFETFYIYVTPVYASMYFPGAAMMYVPALWLGLPYYAGPLAVSGLCAVMIYLVFSELLDGACALLAVLILLCLPCAPVQASMFRMLSIMPMAQTPALLLGLIMTWGVLRWRKDRNWKWLVLTGTAAGWSAITRPADGFCFAAVLGVVLIMDWFDLRKTPRHSHSQLATRNSQLLLPIIIPVIPFLLLQLTLNHNITGHLFTTPFGKYNDANYPGVFGFHTGPAPLHVSDLPERQLFYETNAKSVIEQHQLINFFSVGLRSQIEMIRNVAVPDPYFWLILPISLLAMWNRRYWAVWGMLPVFVLLLSPYAFSWVLPHYYLMVFPAFILLCLLPVRFLGDLFPARAPMIRTMMFPAIASLALMGAPQLNRLVYDQYFKPLELPQIEADISKNVIPPAVVLFHFNPGRSNPSEEPVFNIDVAWPDDAPIIRAHDLNPSVSDVGKPGDQDRPLYEYYARTAPDRIFYLYNRGAQDHRLTPLGTAAQLMKMTQEQK
jgi:hypothetical protein